ncbi:MAG: hypothetical protein M3283_11050 [Actinomycetota bacterium]|nr:hypothetical protein [Actinomycetota bacterium]
MARERLDVKQAAQILGISTDAVHKRVKRGSLDSDKGPDGRVFVHLDEDIDDGYTRPDNVYTSPHTAVRDELVDKLRDRIRYLEEESKRKDAILLRMAERIPELEAPASPEPRESPETASETGAGEEDRGEEERRPWWRRMFAP